MSNIPTGLEWCLGMMVVVGVVMGGYAVYWLIQQPPLLIGKVAVGLAAAAVVPVVVGRVVLKMLDRLPGPEPSCDICNPGGINTHTIPCPNCEISTTDNDTEAEADP